MIIIGGPTPGLHHVDRYPLWLLQTILGPGGGRLFYDIRDRHGMAYDTSMRLALTAESGSIMVYAGTDPANIEAVVELLLLVRQLHAIIVHPTAHRAECRGEDLSAELVLQAVADRVLAQPVAEIVLHRLVQDRRDHGRVVLAVAGGAVAACTSSSSTSSKPAICTSVEQLKASVTKLTQLSAGADALANLRTDLSAVKKNVQAVTSDAKTQYASQATAIRASAAAVQSAANAAISNPNATTVGALATAVRTLSANVTKLSNDVASTCR